MEATVFTPTQIHLLKLFERKKSEDDLKELQEVLCNHYSHKLDAMLESMWQSGELDQRRLDEINAMDLHEFMRRNP